MMDDWRTLPKRDGEKIERVHKPCELCGSTDHYPNYEYVYAGLSVIYCQKCFDIVVKVLKHQMGVKSPTNE